MRLRKAGPSALRERLKLLCDYDCEADVRSRIAELSTHADALDAKIALYRQWIDDAEGSGRRAHPAHPRKENDGQKTDKSLAASDERFAAGMRMLNRVDGEAGFRVLDSLRDVCPELGYHIVAWGFGDVYSREELRPDRQLVTLGMLTALGGCEPQPKCTSAPRSTWAFRRRKSSKPSSRIRLLRISRSLNAMLGQTRLFGTGLLPLADRLRTAGGFGRHSARGAKAGGERAAVAAQAASEPQSERAGLFQSPALSRVSSGRIGCAQRDPDVGRIRRVRLLYLWRALCP